MERKTIAPVTVACHQLKTNLQRIGESVGVVPAMIAEELSGQGIGITGAQIWHYDGCCGDPQKEFALKIAFPVLTTGADTDKITFETLPQFTCITHTHRGSWDGLKNVYCEMFDYCMKNGLQMNSFSREVYLHCDFENADCCVTEVQLGINN